ncbi:MAG: hypothetical protein J6S23_01590 [Clostridia bacterium]|nr:hypothetical protein [Clostridia bacterium]
MKEKYFAVPKVLYSIADRFLLTDKEIGMVVTAIYEYFVGHENLEDITDGMSAQLEHVVTCLICMEEEDYGTC